MSNSINSNVNRVLDSNGDPVSGAKLYAYDTGTTTPQTIYTDKALSTATAVPHVADSEGVFAAIYSANTTDLKIVVKDASDVTLYTLDPAVVQTTGGGASTIAFTPTSRIPDTNTQGAVETVDGYVEQLEKDTSSVYATAGSSNAYTVAVTGVTAYAAGDVYTVRADRANTGAATLNFESVGAKSWQYYDTSGALAEYSAGQIQNGAEFKVLYDGTRCVTLFGSTPRAPWETVETLDGATGSPTDLTTSDFEAGYDYRFVIQGISHNDGGARRIAADFYGVTLAGYVTQSSTWTTAPLVYSLAAQVAANLFDGVAEIESPRSAKDIHVLSTSGHDEAAGYGDPLVRVPTRGDVMCTFFAADDAVQKIKFTWTGGVAFDAGTIRVEKRLSSS